MCPVCRWPGTSVACERCRQDQVDPTRPLTDRQREHDLRAATRAAAGTWPADGVLIEWLARIIRGGQPLSDQIKQAMTGPSWAEPPTVSSAGIVFALTRLVAGRTGAIAFVEIGPDAVSLQTLVVDWRGVPVLHDADSSEWTALVPSLPDHLGLRYLRMAGGVGDPRMAGFSEPDDYDPATLTADLRAGISFVLARFKKTAAKVAAQGQADRPAGAPLGPPRLPDSVLVRRVRDWPLLDAAAGQARSELHPLTEITTTPDARPLDEVVAAVAGRAPLRYGYDLILVDVEKPAGIVRPRPHELFPAGLAVGDGSLPVATVTVKPVPRYSAAQVALPVVVRRGPVDLRDGEALEQQWPLVALADVDVAAGEPFEVRVELAGPGQARLKREEVSLPDAAPGGWPALIADLPERLRMPPRLPEGRLDLAVLVELGGSEAAVAARTDLIKGVVSEFHRVPGIRIAVLGYRDHHDVHQLDATGIPGQERTALLVGSIRGFTAPAELTPMLERSEWRAVSPTNDDAAPVEDALWWLGTTSWRWKPDTQHVVVIVGRRPPHPPEHQRGYRMRPCDEKKSWPETLSRLQAEQSLRCFAVLDQAPEPGYAASAWQSLTESGRSWIGHPKPRRLARECCGLLPPSPARLGLATLDRASSSPAPARWRNG
jgi:hypothetical protein